MLYRFIFCSFDRLVKMLIPFFDPAVLNGPFKKMRYIPEAIGSSFMPKILGTYEEEVSGCFEDKRFDIGFDVGAAEGYYAVGLVYSGVCQKMIAWEMTEEGRNLMASLAHLNGISQSLEIRGECTFDELRKCLEANVGKSVFLVVDCEGFEGNLLENMPAELLGNCSLLIETHDPLNPGVHERLTQKLECSHSVQVIAPRKRTLSDLGGLPTFFKMVAMAGFGRLAMAERRFSGIKWLICEPKQEPK